MNAPERIWIDWTEANANDFAYPEPPRHDFDGCEDEYIRADLHAAALARAERAEAERDKLQGDCDAAEELNDKLEAALYQAGTERAQVEIALHTAEALLKEAVEALRQGDTAMEEAEAILGGEYDIHHQFLCDSIMLFRATFAKLKENGHE